MAHPSSSSSSSQFSSSIAAIILLAILAALILCAAVARGSGDPGSKKYQFWDSSQSHRPRVRSAGLTGRKVMTFDQCGDKEREKEGEEEEKKQKNNDQTRREVFDSRIGILPKGYDDKDSEGRRVTQQETTNQFLGLDFDKSLLSLHGDVLSSFPCAKCYIRSLLLSQDEQTIYFANDNIQTTSLIGKAIRLPNPSSSPPSASSSQSPPASYSVSNITVVKSIRVTGLEMLVDNLSVLVGYRGKPGISEVNVITGKSQAFISGPTALFGMVRHPKKADLFIGAFLRVLMVPLSDEEAPPDSRSTIAGGNLPGNRDGNVSEFGNESPRINPRSITSDGSVLYIADRSNLLVRRVSTTTNETQTLRFANLTEVIMSFGPLAVVITSDHCNLFVTGWRNYSNPTGLPSVVRWLALDSPDGNVSWMRDIIFFNETVPSPPPQPVEWTGVNEPSRLLLGHNDTDLYVGTSNGQIFQFAINRSALHKCGPYDPANPPGFGPLLPYVRPAVNDNHSSLMLTVGLSVAAAALILLGVATTLLLWWRRMLCFHSKRGLLGICTNAASSAHQPMSQQQWLNDKAPLSAPTWDDSKITSSGMTTVTDSSLRYGDQLALSSISRELGHLDAPRRIPFADLREATDGFSDTHKVAGARGGFGDLYRATLRVGGEKGEMADVALKVMRGALDKLKRKQFISEVTTLSRARHAHLCKLLGYCAEGNMVVLVYPFVSGGSLHDRLHPRSRPSAQPLPSPTTPGAPTAPCSIPPHDHLDWRSRLSVVLQIGTALRYLHEELEPPLLHRDVKSCNVLVEGSGEHVKAYLTDFGLAKLGNPSTGLEKGRETVQTAYRAGTVGYMAPEYAIELKLTAKNDVYAFGVILLEMVSGKSGLFWNSTRESRDQSEDDDNAGTCDDAPSDSDSDGDGGRQPVLLVHWTRRRFERASNWDYELLRKMVDPQLVQSFEVPGGSNWERETLCAVAKLGLVCTDADASNRPTMGVVVERIKAIVQGERK